MLLLLAPGLVLFLIFQLASHLRQQRWGWRASMLMTGLAWGSIVVILTELLSLNQKLNSSSLALAWGIVLVFLLGVFSRLVYKAGPELRNLIPARAEVYGWMKEQGPGIWVMLAALGIHAFLLAVVALAYAPNTYESMTYQLPRVIHWLQNGSLANFAVSNVRQDYFPPFAEYAFLQQLALVGGDRYVNLIQWSAFLVVLIEVSAVAAELGAQRNTQVAAALLCAGIPLAVLQATTARNDLIVAAWLVSLVWFGLRWSRQPDSWLWAAGTGLSLGLALLTKASGYIYAFPLGLLNGILVIKNGGLRVAMARGALTLLLALALNLPHISRNWILYRDLSGAQERVGSEIMSPAVFVSVTLRNMAMQVPSDCAPPLAILNLPGRWLLAGLGRLHALTGLSPTDPRTTWGFVDVFQTSMGCVYNEHFAGNALHTLLILAVCLTLPFLRSVNPLAKWFALALVMGFVLLNLVTRWQVWGSHLQLPLFVLWTPIVALALNRVRGQDLSRMAAWLALILSFLWIYNNEMRPLSGLISGSMPSRDEQYFRSTQVGYSDYNSMTELITGTGCDRVGLRISSLALEYPLWVMLQEKGFEGTIEHIDITNETSVFEDTAFVPCAVVSEGFSPDHAAIMTEHSFGAFLLYLNEADVKSQGE